MALPWRLQQRRGCDCVVMKTRGVSFRHAVELLRDDHPSLVAGDGRVVRKGTTVKLASPVTADADDQQTLREDVWPQDHAEPARRNTAASVPAGAA